MLKLFCLCTTLNNRLISLIRLNLLSSCLFNTSSLTILTSFILSFTIYTEAAFVDINNMFSDKLTGASTLKLLRIEHNQNWICQNGCISVHPSTYVLAC